jgi:putative inorganic carbon (hco3(-)) transporter
MLNPFRPFVYLLIYLAVVYVRPHEYVPEIATWPVHSTLLVIAFVLWIFEPRKSFEASQFWLLPVLCLVMALSVIFTGWLRGGVNVITDFTPVVLLFYMVATTTVSLVHLRRIFFVLSICMTIIALHGIDQSNTGIGWTGAELSQGTRITYLGFLNDPNDLAMALVMALPMTLNLGRHSWTLMRVLSLICAGLLLYAIYLTNSRGAMIALGAMLILYSFLNYGLFKGIVAIPICAIPMLIVAPSRIAEISVVEASADDRIRAWFQGFQLLVWRPLFGVGEGFFVEHNGGLTAHNSFVLAFAEIGLIGYFFWFSILALSWWMLHRVVHSGPPVGASPEKERRWEDVRSAARTLWYSYAGGLACAFFLSRSFVLILYLHIALIVAVFQVARTSWPGFPPVLWRDHYGKLLLLSLGSIVAMWAIVRVLLAVR